MAEVNSKGFERIQSFTGTFDFNLDAKGRVNIPARIREIIELKKLNALALRIIEKEGCLFIRAYPIDYYNKHMLGKMDDWDAEDEYQMFAMMGVTAPTNQVSIDGQGRLNIPDDMLKEVNINKQVRFVGMNNFFDIWNPSTFEAFYNLMATRLKKDKKLSDERGGAS
ncbi:MAG: hypothetical protein H6696_07545 [Deferribacteres bacterium]|nr:hypothetical protein [candidate division KSB1 bacterium]MCB9501778.1 hypothetical protein [Deferribacteres bacterium]